MKKLVISLVILLGLTTALVPAMEQEEIWYGQDLPQYHRFIATSPEGHKVLILSGPDQNGYFARVIFFLEGPRKGTIMIDSDDFGYEDRRTLATDKDLFEFLQQKYFEQFAQEKG